MINEITMDGRLAKNVDYQATKDGVPLARFTMANTRKDKDKNKIVQFFIITAFGSRADYCHKYLKRGQRIFLRGVNNHHEQKNSDGSYNDYYTIIAKEIDPISYRSHPAQDKSERDIYSKYDRLNAKLAKISKKVGIK